MGTGSWLASAVLRAILRSYSADQKDRTLGTNGFMELVCFFSSLITYVKKGNRRSTMADVKALEYSTMKVGLYLVYLRSVV